MTMRTAMTRVVTPLVLSMCGVFAAAPARAQEPRVHFGLIAGSNVSNVVWSPEPGFDLQWLRKLDFGFLADVRCTDRLSIETRLMWQRQGTTAIVSRTPLAHVTYTFDSAAVPVLFKARLSTGRIQPYVLAGPQFAFKRRAAVVTEVAGQRESETLTDNDVKSVDVALHGGGGLEIPTGHGSMFIEAGYSWGIRNMNNDRTEPDTVKTRAFLLGAGVRF